MSKNHSLPFRRALVSALTNAPSINAIVGSRVYGESAPARPVKPFIRVGVMIPSSFEATKLNGMEADFTVHALCRGEATNEVYELNDAIVTFLEYNLLKFDNMHVVSMIWLQSPTVPDVNEVGDWHGLNMFRVTTSDDY